MVKYIIAIIALFASFSAHSKTYKERVNDAFEQAAKRYSVNLRVLRAICWQESHHKTYAYRPNDAADGTAAYGICQILYTTGIRLGVHDKKCLNEFKPRDWRNNQYKNCKLFGLKTNIFAAARYLRFQVKRYNGNYKKAVAAYNAGSYRICPKNGWQMYKGKRYKRCKPGGPLNQYYIDKVEKAYKEGR